jgi:L-seryl-tRNA(Ser) seleniumtransferase
MSQGERATHAARRKPFHCNLLPTYAQIPIAGDSMDQPSKLAPKMVGGDNPGFRDLPSVDELLGRPSMISLSSKFGRPIVLSSARCVLARVRAQTKSDGRPQQAGGNLEAAISADVETRLGPSLRRVINATGVVLHTNLGRAPLAPDAADAIASTATRYSNLEYDLGQGKRGRRDAHTSEALAELAGAEAAIVVNNNAAAVFLVLHALAKGQEVIVSRGELIEIGDGFRIPDIMTESGAVIREVGTTNRTHIRDYESAIGEGTRLLLRVHPSNFHMTGFAGRPSLEELVATGERFHVPVYEDLGSGCLADLSEQGIGEPLVGASCAAGVSVVTFSSDKLLGGPQAGVIAGKKEIIERIRRNPVFRALRVDKLTIAALEVTAKAYLRGALDEIPALRMIRMTPEKIRERAERFVSFLRPRLPGHANAEVLAGYSVIGGGSTPDQQLASYLVALNSQARSARRLEERLRQNSPGIPVIARIENDRVVFDLRTVQPDEESELMTAILQALGS